MTILTKTNTLVPSVWIGCLACYNAGHLVGDWYPATTAAEVSWVQVHHADPLARKTCDGEELWVMDIESMPVSEEMSPEHAQRWGELCEEIGLDHVDALRAWIASGTHVVDGDDIPCVEDFWERYAGCYDSWEDFVEHVAGEMDLLDHVPEHLRGYVDVQRWGRDLALDYAVEPAPGAGVFVFHIF